MPWSTGCAEPKVRSAGFAIISTNLKQCLMMPDGADSVDTKALEKLFLSLA